MADEDKAELSAEEIQQAQAQETELSSRAQLYGWVPKEDFRGDVTKWVDANTFLKRAEEILPIARSMNKKLENDLVMTKKELAEATKAIKAVIQAHKKEAEGSYETKLSQITEKQIKAVAEGDSETWARLEQEKQKLQKPAEIAYEVQSDNSAEAAIVSQWKRDNSWYDSDPELGTYADAVSNFIAVRRGKLPPDELLKLVKEEVQKRFPEKFENRNRHNPPAIDRSNFGGNGDSKNGKKTYSDLPKDAKDACDSLVAQKVLTRESYVKTYFEE
jgi:hypothetical protein